MTFVGKNLNAQAMFYKSFRELYGISEYLEGKLALVYGASHIDHMVSKPLESGTFKPFRLFFVLLITFTCIHVDECFFKFRLRHQE